MGNSFGHTDPRTEREETITNITPTRHAAHQCRVLPLLQTGLSLASLALILKINYQSPAYFLKSLSLYTDIFYMLEKAGAPHSSTVAWKIPWTEEPGRLQSMGL